MDPKKANGFTEIIKESHSSLVDTDWLVTGNQTSTGRDVP